MQMVESMTTTQGDYGEARWLAPHIVELIPRHGIEINAEQIDIIYDQAISQSGGYCALLVNRKYDYSLSFSAHRKVAAHEGLVALAYLTHSPASAQVAEYTARLAPYARCPIRVFQDRDEALLWLEQQLAAWPKK